MKQSKAILLIFIGLMLVTLTSTLVSAQNEYGWEYENPAAPWAFWSLFTGALCFIPLVIFIIWIVLAIWVYKDAERRGSSGALWLIIVIITGIIGLIIWLIVRPPEGGKKTTEEVGANQRRCPKCGRVIPDDARVCPYCGNKFEV
jgi:Na+/H+-dicarboxylate symporter